jgi:hypothetical protein
MNIRRKDSTSKWVSEFLDKYVAGDDETETIVLIEQKEDDFEMRYGFITKELNRIEFTYNGCSVLLLGLEILGYEKTVF